MSFGMELHVFADSWWRCLSFAMLDTREGFPDALRSWLCLGPDINRYFLRSDLCEDSRTLMRAQLSEDLLSLELCPCDGSSCPIGENLTSTRNEEVLTLVFPRVKGSCSKGSFSGVQSCDVLTWSVSHVLRGALPKVKLHT